MTNSLTWWRALVASSVVLCLVLAITASGQATKPASGFGIVDVQKVTTDYKDMQAAQGELRVRQAKSEAKLARRANMPFLSEEEQKQMDDIEAKDPAGRTAVETAKLKELADKGARLNVEIDQLRQKKDTDLTDADKQKLKDAETARVSAEQVFASLKDRENTEIREFGVANQERLMKSFRTAIKKIAEAKGVAVVFDSQIALYAGSDLTDDVIKELNKK